MARYNLYRISRNNRVGCQADLSKVLNGCECIDVRTRPETIGAFRGRIVQIHFGGNGTECHGGSPEQGVRADGGRGASARVAVADIEVGIVGPDGNAATRLDIRNDACVHMAVRIDTQCAIGDERSGVLDVDRRRIIEIRVDVGPCDCDQSTTGAVRIGICTNAGNRQHVNAALNPRIHPWRFEFGIGVDSDDGLGVYGQLRFGLSNR